MNHWFFLASAIVFEAAGTTSMKLSAGLTRLVPSLNKGIPRQLTHKSLLKAVRLLAAQDRNLEMIVSEFGPPPLWEREQGFHTLIHIILEQQVSLASANSAYGKLLMAAKTLTPENFLKFTDVDLKSMGFSRQKTSYGRNLAHAILEGRLDLSVLGRYEDLEVKQQLMKVKGIGSWTADIYLLMALGRPDIWPGADLALAAAIQRLRQMPVKPSREELDEMSRKWQPWRAAAARILWHFYLSVR